MKGRTLREAQLKRQWEVATIAKEKMTEALRIPNPSVNYLEGLMNIYLIDLKLLDIESEMEELVSSREGREPKFTTVADIHQTDISALR